MGEAARKVDVLRRTKRGIQKAKPVLRGVAPSAEAGKQRLSGAAGLRSRARRGGSGGEGWEPVDRLSG